MTGPELPISAGCQLRQLWPEFRVEAQQSVSKLFASKAEIGRSILFLPAPPEIGDQYQHSKIHSLPDAALAGV